ncbi:hypothetical protein BY458DRAFT_453211 [Sporodiniella umbellata]|nr:hypothetical protein BY458DRAFT_453211 [Sporodiniella umbellata]
MMISVQSLLNKPSQPEKLNIQALLNKDTFHYQNTSPVSLPEHIFREEDWDEEQLKTKRKRASSEQLQVLSKVFRRTFFPSTQMRVQLGRQLKMSPRTVQIWFQNRRQAMRTKERQRLAKPL